MFRFTCLAIVIVCTLADDMDLKAEWEEFKVAFSKSYEGVEEDNKRQEQWEKTVKSILKHNLEADMGAHSYHKGVNQYSDMTEEEFKQSFPGLVIPENITYNYMPPSFDQIKVELPENFDWRDQGAVTSVKNQGIFCGSCWTFSAAGALEGAWAIKTGQLVELSEQELLDCSEEYGTTGCQGGWPNFAFDYVKDKGLGTYSCYPYDFLKYDCRAQDSCKITKITKHYDVPKTESDLQEYLYKYGPVSVTINYNANVKNYKTGILDDPTCDDKVNHAVLLVGYGTENGTPYWTLKNSYGSEWGDRGYFKLIRGKSMCAIEKYASIPWLQ